MKYAGCVACSLLCKHSKFGEKTYYNSRDTECFLGDYFLLACPIYSHFNLGRALPNLVNFR